MMTSAAVEINGGENVESDLSYFDSEENDDVTVIIYSGKLMKMKELVMTSLAVEINGGVTSSVIISVPLF